MADLLTLFEDENYSPIEFIDSIFVGHRQNLNNNNNVLILIKTLTNILNNLTGYIGSLQIDLQLGIQEIQKTCQKIGIGEDDQITRLQYYVENIESLVSELKNDSNKISGNHQQMNNNKQGAINALIGLKKIKANLASVVKLFETAKFIATIDKTQSDQQYAPTNSEETTETNIIITPETFKNSLDILKEILIEQLQAEALEISDKDLLNKIDSLMELKKFFKNLNYYETIYSKFIEQIEDEQEAKLKQLQHPDIEINVQSPPANEEVSETSPEPIEDKKEALGALSGFMNFFGKT